ncbi:MAG: phage holin family protein [Patescibacteria group bacterium]
MRKVKAYVRFLIIWLVNAGLFYLATSLYPANFVLGNASLTPLWAAVVSGFLLTVLCRWARPVLSKIGLSLSGRLKMFVFYWLVNAGAIWLIARFSYLTGFGITAYYWALALGFVTNLSQWVVRQIFKAAGLT